MGILDPPSSIQPSSLAHPTRSSDGAYIAPDRTSRAHCWEARDRFFDCLDRNGIVDSIKNSGKATEHCNVEDQGFIKECAMSWVTYFKQRRVMEHNKKQTLARLSQDGAKPLPPGMGPPGLQGSPPA